MPIRHPAAMKVAGVRAQLMADMFSQTRRPTDDHEFFREGSMRLVSLEDFERWFDEADALFEALERRRGPDTWALMRDRARRLDMAYAWARCEPMQDLDPDWTDVQALDVARWFLWASMLMLTAAARLSGVCASSLETLEIFREPRAGQ